MYGTECLVYVDSKELEYWPGTIYAGFPSSLDSRLWVAGQSYSNLAAPTVP